jgi:hypothetical protein
MQGYTMCGARYEDNRLRSHCALRRRSRSNISSCCQALQPNEHGFRTAAAEVKLCISIVIFIVIIVFIIVIVVAIVVVLVLLFLSSSSLLLFLFSLFFILIVIIFI